MECSSCKYKGTTWCNYIPEMDYSYSSMSQVAAPCKNYAVMKEPTIPAWIKEVVSLAEEALQNIQGKMEYFAEDDEMRACFQFDGYEYGYDDFCVTVVICDSNHIAVTVETPDNDPGDSFDGNFITWRDSDWKASFYSSIFNHSKTLVKE